MYSEKNLKKTLHVNFEYLRYSLGRRRSRRRRSQRELKPKHTDHENSKTSGGRPHARTSSPSSHKWPSSSSSSKNYQWSSGALVDGMVDVLSFSTRHRGLRNAEGASLFQAEGIQPHTHVVIVLQRLSLYLHFGHTLAKAHCAFVYSFPLIKHHGLIKAIGVRALCVLPLHRLCAYHYSKEKVVGQLDSLVVVFCPATDPPNAQREGTSRGDGNFDLAAV